MVAGPGRLELLSYPACQKHHHFGCAVVSTCKHIWEIPPSFHKSLTSSVRCGQWSRKAGMRGQVAGGRWWAGWSETIEGFTCRILFCPGRNTPVQPFICPWGSVCRLCSLRGCPCHRQVPSPSPHFLLNLHWIWLEKSSVRHLHLSNLNYFNFRHCSFVSENLYKLLFEILKELTYGCFKKHLFIMFMIYHLTFSQLNVTHMRFLLVLLIGIFWAWCIVGAQ